MRDEEGGGDVEILAHEYNERVREFAEDIAFALMPKDRDSLIALYKRIDAQTECISGLNALVERQRRAIRSVVNILRGHDLAPKERGEFAACGHEFPVITDYLIGILKDSGDDLEGITTGHGTGG